MNLNINGQRFLIVLPDFCDRTEHYRHQRDGQEEEYFIPFLSISVALTGPEEQTIPIFIIYVHTETDIRREGGFAFEQRDRSC